MEEDEDTYARLHLLCKRSGKSWSVMDGVLFGNMLKERRFTLFARLFSNPVANFKAFVNTMKRAWRIEDMVYADLGSGLFAFTFKAKEDRIVESGPWSFANHLVLLKPWEPNTPSHHYEFVTCAFWVQICGLPLGWYSVDVVNVVAQGIGKVLDAKVERKGLLSPGAKVEINPDAPSRSGTLASCGDKKLWLDFKYETPYFCCSCGKLGHYVKHYTEIPYEEGNFIPGNYLYFGKWLRAEVDESTPFWKAFCEVKVEEDIYFQIPLSTTLKLWLLWKELLALITCS